MARRAHLQKFAEVGNGAANAALKLGNDPRKFGILNGIVGEAALAGPLSTRDRSAIY